MIQQYQQGQTNPESRVMSPNSLRVNEGILSNLQTTCQICNGQVYEPSMCAGCGVFGHPVCLHLEHFMDYSFCRKCIPRAISEYASFQDAQRRDEWKRSLVAQICSWKTRAIECIGMSSTIGVAVGGAVATAAGVAAGLAQGAVRGAVGATASGRLALPPPAESVVEEPAEMSRGRVGFPSDSMAAGHSSTTPAEPAAMPSSRVVHQSDSEAARQSPTMLMKRSRSSENHREAVRGHCLACWSPQLGFLRPISHTYCGDCKITPGRSAWGFAPLGDTLSGGNPSDSRVVPPPEQTPDHLLDQMLANRPSMSGVTSGVGWLTQRQLELPRSQESLFASVASSTEHPPTLEPDRDTSQQQGFERQLKDMQREFRSEMQNLMVAVKTASEDSQRVAARLEHMEYEWLVWNDAQQADATHQEPLIQLEDDQQLQGNSLTQELDDLLGPPTGPTELLQQRRDAGLLQEAQSLNALPQPLFHPASLAPGGGMLQVTTGEHVENRDDMPPGLDLMMANATKSRARERPEGLVQTAHLSHGKGGCRGDACLVPALAADAVLPGITTVMPRTMPDLSAEAPQGDRNLRDSDVYDFLAGTWPRTSGGPTVSSGEPIGIEGMRTAGAPAVAQPSAQGRGAAPPGTNLPSSADNNLQTLQSRTANSPASMDPPSMAELNIILKTVQTLVPEFPKL